MNLLLTIIGWVNYSFLFSCGLTHSFRFNFRIGWVKLPETEAYYADSSSGNTEKFEEALKFALDHVEKVPNFSFEMFDKDENKLIDSVVFIHSGYAAEWGATDCMGNDLEDRIW